jgi:putative endonuclease
MHYVYVLRSEKDGRFYVGMTGNVNRRIKEHNAGRAKSTKGWRPWKLFFVEEVDTRVEAREREKHLKSGVGKEYIKELWSHTCLPAGRAQKD